MQSIEYNKENHPILKRIYDILAELQTQDKQIILCKFPAHKDNQEADRAAKQAIDMWGMTTTDYLIQTSTWLSGVLETLNGKGTSKSCIEEWESAQNSFRQYGIMLNKAPYWTH